MTPAEIIYHRRVRVLAHAKQSGNVAATCRTFGISRTRFYEWRNVAELYGLEALMPKARVDLAAREPEAEIERLLALGATLVDKGKAALWRTGNGTRWVVMQDPEGNEFCLG